MMESLQVLRILFDTMAGRKRYISHGHMITYRLTAIATQDTAQQVEEHVSEMAVGLHNGPVKGLELIKGLPADGELGELSLGTCDAHRPVPTARDARRSSNSLQSGARRPSKNRNGDSGESGWQSWSET